jgi:hypothetical protein
MDLRELLLTMDPDEVVDYLGITTEELVDHLDEYLRDRERDEYDEDEGY